MSARTRLAAALLLSACSLERDWDRWQLAAQTAPGYSTSDTSSTSLGDERITGGSSSSSDASADDVAAAEADGDASTSGGEATATTAASTDESSTGRPAVCGDGHVDAELGEECDPDSEHCVGCRRSRLIFVTSVFLQGGEINGLQGADAYCRSLAAAARAELPDSPIVDPGNFKALLSTSTQTIADRHFPGEGPYRLVNGLPVADSFARLFSEPHHNPVNVDERSETVSSPVWTGTAGDGTPYPGIDFCGDWTDLYGTANWGASDYVDSWWLHADVALNPDPDCAAESPIYCVEQE